MSQVPATQADMQFASTGLEDFAVSDAVLPRIKIEHATGKWVDNLGGLSMEELHFIVLGLAKGRVLFHTNVEDGDVPMCKSANMELGFPNPDAPAKKSFPWDLAGFDPNDYPADAEGNRALPCSSCALKDWGTNPANGQTPYCSEQWNMPIYYYPDPTQPDILPAVLTLQKSSVKPIRTYLTSFAGANKPPFINLCKGTLKVQQRGQVTFSTPSFVKMGETDRSRWLEFSNQFIEMKAMLTRPPIRESDGAALQGDNTNVAPIQQAPVQQQDPWSGQTVPGAVVEQPQAPAAPVQQAPVAAPPVAAPVPAPAPSPPPVQEAAPVAPTAPAASPVAAPVAQPAPPAPPVQQEAPPTPPAPAGGTGLPF